MFESIGNFFKKFVKPENKETGSKEDAKERLHLVLMQDRANVSADFLELMKQEIIDVIKKYIVVDEASIDVRLTNQPNDDGTNGAPALYANIPIVNIKNDMKAEKIKEFEGVNFDKKLEENKNNEKSDSESKKSDDSNNKEINEDIESHEENNISDIKENIAENNENENEEDDDDDVTFDDLLKAAESEDNKKVSKE
jgi:cell division topological specificity factor